MRKQSKSVYDIMTAVGSDGGGCKLDELENRGAKGPCYFPVKCCPTRNS